jgi:excisionase family DNA binding protein
MLDLLTIDEAAAWLRIPVETLYKWRSQGTGPRAAKVGKHLRYRSDELRRWVEEREQDQRRAEPRPAETRTRRAR